jgi:polyisoprenoid-binding protein YceI
VRGFARARPTWPNLRVTWTATLLALAAAAGPAPEITYAVDAARSSVIVHVGRSGAFSFAGHTHTVSAPALEGRVVAAAERGDFSRSSVRLSFATARLTVLERGEPEGDAPKVQAAMLGPKVLDAARFPAITFQSTAVSGAESGPGAYSLTVQGSLTLHGVTRIVTLPLNVEIGPDGLLKASGRMTVRQTDYGIAPVSVAGLVKVKNELAIEYAIVAQPAGR